MIKERASGILLHPTSIPTRYGIGDLGPRAFDFIDWLAGAQQQYWQVLPLCPTDTGDSPYQSPSSFAGNPLLISPDLLKADGLLTDADLEAASIPEVEYLGQLDFGPVWQNKQLLLDTSDGSMRQLLADYQLQREFAEFCHQHFDWVENHARFMAQRSANKNQAWQYWTESLSPPGNSVRPELGEQFVSALLLQFFFVRQWQSLRKYARERNIRIIGDMPIYVS